METQREIVRQALISTNTPSLYQGIPVLKAVFSICLEAFFSCQAEDWSLIYVFAMGII